MTRKISEPVTAPHPVMHLRKIGVRDLHVVGSRGGGSILVHHLNGPVSVGVGIAIGET